MSRNIYQSPLDGIIYFILYLCVPLGQCLAYILIDPTLFWFSAFLAVASLLYDSYTRFSKKASSAKKRKILWIGFISFFLFVFSIMILVLRSNGVEVNDYWRLPYLLLVVPFVISFCDGVDIFFKTIEKGVV